MIIKTSSYTSLEIAGTVDKDGDLVLWAEEEGNTVISMWLNATQQDQLIAHLIEVRGAARVQELLNRSDT